MMCDRRRDFVVELLEKLMASKTTSKVRDNAERSSVAFPEYLDLANADKAT